MRKFNLIILLLIFSVHELNAQIKFQKQFAQPDSASSFETFDAKQTPDGGYVLTGLASQGTSTTYHPFLLKLDCQGKEVWKVFFGNSQTTGNVFPKVIVTQDSQYVLINNIGTYFNYNGLAAKVDQGGNVVWQKMLNLSSGNDIINDVKETSDGHLIITGAAKSPADVSVTKLNSDGSFVWNKTYGNVGEIDEGSAIIETNDGGYMITGRYISMLTFNAFLMKTDSSGAFQWLKCYGDTNQHMWGLDVKELPNGDFVMVGSTTLLKPSYTSFSDNYIMRLNSVGDTLWSRIFYGVPDQFENVSSVEVDALGNFILGVATASYATTGFVPNKNAIMKFSSTGTLMLARTYNTGSSHYTRINKANDNGFIISGFSNNYSGPVGFQTLFMKLDENLTSGCFETDQYANTIVTSIPFKITQPIPSFGTSGSVTNNTATWTTTIKDSTLCETFPILNTNFNAQPVCIDSIYHFEIDSTGLTSIHWNFGDAGIMDTSNNAKTSYTYSTPGNYTVTLKISNGCETDSIQKVIEVKSPSLKPNLGNDTTICGGVSIQIQPSETYSNYSWSNGSTDSTISVNTPGLYILTIDDSPCGKQFDSIQIYMISCDTSYINNCTPFIPNAFSPNGDGLNDEFVIKISNNQQQVNFMQMEIYNRWGNRVFKSTDIKQGWDGKINGKDQSIDTYYFFIRYKCGDETILNKGDLILIR